MEAMASVPDGKAVASAPPPGARSPASPRPTFMTLTLTGGVVPVGPKRERPVP